MAKKKVFGVSKDLTRGFTETVTLVENNVGQCRYEAVSLLRIEPDPENPRELALTLTDIKNGLNPDDHEYERKKQEYESLESLAQTIKEQGLINPVVVYKHYDNYRLVAGERRYLASHIANKTDVQAKILDGKPTNLNLRLLQWIENNEREALSLKDRVLNVRAIVIEHMNIHNEEPNSSQLGKMMGLSHTNAANYLAVVYAPDDIQNLLAKGLLTNLEKVSFLSKIENAKIREIVTEACLSGATLKEMKTVFERETGRLAVEVLKQEKKPVANGRPPLKYNLGTTQNMQVMETLFKCVFEYPTFRKLKGKFSNVNFQNPKEVNQAFQQLLQILEAEGSQQ